MGTEGFDMFINVDYLNTKEWVVAPYKYIRADIKISIESFIRIFN